jgi:hypothetical protein
VVLLLWLYHFRYSCEEIYELLWKCRGNFGNKRKFFWSW